jgi:flavin-dependent dehydrogenase
MTLEMSLPESWDTAVVLGASISGLLAARVLAEFYRDVIVVERDVLPDGPVPLFYPSTLLRVAPKSRKGLRATASA